jgi:hypothetical protein
MIRNNQKQDVYDCEKEGKTSGMCLHCVCLHFGNMRIRSVTLGTEEGNTTWCELKLNAVTLKANKTLKDY